MLCKEWTAVVCVWLTHPSSWECWWLTALSRLPLWKLSSDDGTHPRLIQDRTPLPRGSLHPMAGWWGRSSGIRTFLRSHSSSRMFWRICWGLCCISVMFNFSLSAQPHSPYSSQMLFLRGSPREHSIYTQISESQNMLPGKPNLGSILILRQT